MIQIPAVAIAVYAEHLDAETVALSSELIVADGSVSGCAVATLLEETAAELRASCPEHGVAAQADSPPPRFRTRTIRSLFRKARR